MLISRPCQCFHPARLGTVRPQLGDATNRHQAHACQTGSRDGGPPSPLPSRCSHLHDSSPLGGPPSEGQAEGELTRRWVAFGRVRSAESQRRVERICIGVGLRNRRPRQRSSASGPGWVGSGKKRACHRRTVHPYTDANHENHHRTLRYQGCRGHSPHHPRGARGRAPVVPGSTCSRSIRRTC